MTIEEAVDLEMREKTYASEFIKPDLTEDYLSHHGILGMRWGRRNGPPYPLGSDVSTGTRLKSGAAGSIEKKKPKKQTFAEKRKAKKVYKKRVAAAQKARETKARKAEEARAKAAEEERKAKEAQEAQDRAEQEQLEREQWKRDVINRGDAKTASEHTDLFSNQEIQEIIDRYHATDRLSQVVADANPPDPTPEQKSKLDTMREKVDKIQKFAGTVSDLANSAKKVYDAVNTVNDILNSGGKKAEEARKTQAKEAEEARKKSEEAVKAREEDWKKSVIMNRDKETMMKNKNRFTSSEIKELLGNIEADEKLAEKISGASEKKEETKSPAPSESGKSQEGKPKESNTTQQPSKSAESGSKKETQSEKPNSGMNWRVSDKQLQRAQQRQSHSKESKEQDLSPSLMDKVMARAKNAAEAQRAANTRQKHDKAYYQGQSSQVLELMKANLEEDNGPVSQINMIDDILKDRRKRGR